MSRIVDVGACRFGACRCPINLWNHFSIPQCFRGIQFLLKNGMEWGMVFLSGIQKSG